jgi:hypothetical protein
MKKLIYLLLLFPFLFTLACTKKEEKIPLSQEFRSYIDFPVGSYWIYKDTAVDTIESIYVFENKTSWELDRSNVYFELLTIHFVHVSKNFTDTIYGQGGCDVGYRNLDNPLFSFDIALPKYGIMGILKFYTPNEASDQGPYRGRPYIKSKDDKLEIQGKEYKNTIKTEFAPGGETYNGIKSEVYAQDVGVIRTVYADGHVFDLIRYHIKK